MDLASLKIHVAVALCGAASAVHEPYVGRKAAVEPVFAPHIMVSFHKKAGLLSSKFHQKFNDLCGFTPTIYVVAQEDKGIAGLNLRASKRLQQSLQSTVYITNY